MIDWGVSGRRDTFSAHLVDPFSLQDTGEIVDMVEGTGNITWRYDAENVVSASLHLANATAEGKMIRIKHGMEFPDGQTYSETLGTFFPDSSRAAATMGSVDRTVDCYSALYRFTQDVLARDFARSRGTVIIDEVRDLVTIDGGKMQVLPGVDEARRHTIDIWFEVGTNRYRVLDTIAGWTGCEIGVDPDGYITWGPYVAPEMKPVSFTFEDGANCIYKDSFTLEDTGSDAVNRVVAAFSRQSKGDGDNLPLSDSVYVDLPSYHRYSYESIGRRKSYYMDVSEPCTHDELTEQATRELLNRCGGVQYYEIEHVGCPLVKVGSVVEYVSKGTASKELDLMCLVEEISMSLSPGCMCKTKLRAL